MYGHPSSDRFSLRNRAFEHRQRVTLRPPRAAAPHERARGGLRAASLPGEGTGVCATRIRARGPGARPL